MPGVTAFCALAAIADLYPAVPIIVLSASETIRTV
jgi:hypothetical protein